MKALAALDKLLSAYSFDSVLDIGLGEGLHAEVFRRFGKRVTAVDFGGSEYYQGRVSDAHRIGDYLEMSFEEPFDCIWCSHVLEHQRNVGAFLEKIHTDLREGGVLAITVPPRKPNIVGGHVTLWNAGLLLYNLVLAGFDCSEARVKQYDYNISVLVRKKSVDVDTLGLTFDIGDIERLAHLFPFPAKQDFDGDIAELGWNDASQVPAPSGTQGADARKIPVFHVASMARSGETVLLRSLDAHSRIRVVHNLRSHDTQNQQALFEHLQRHEPQTIRIDHELLRGSGIRPDHALVLKQGVWEHPAPFRGVVLARNPASIYASLRTYDVAEHGDDLDANWRFNEERLLHWARAMDPLLERTIAGLPPLLQFSAFYNRRMMGLWETGLPVVHFERLIVDPEAALRAILAELGLAYEEGVARAHELYRPGELGHGHIELAAPFSDAPNRKYTEVLTREEFAHLAELTGATARTYGYHLEWERIGIGSSERFLVGEPAGARTA